MGSNSSLFAAKAADVSTALNFMSPNLGAVGSGGAVGTGWGLESESEVDGSALFVLSRGLGIAFWSVGAKDDSTFVVSSILTT